MSLLASFPSRYVPRQAQKRVIGEIDSAIQSGYRHILLCMPTGVGKSHIAVTVAKYLGSSFIVTAQKILQNQYTRDFGFIYPMKGKQNFPCLALYDPGMVTYEQASKNPLLSCSYGRCTWEVTLPDGGKRFEICKHKSSVGRFSVLNKGTEREEVIGPKNKKCYYYDQKFKALAATHALFNYSSYFQTRLFSRGIEEYLDRECLVADEAHEIEDQIIGYIGFEILPAHMQDADLRFEDFAAETVDGALDVLYALGDSYTRIIQKMDEEDPENDKSQKFRRRRERIDVSAREIRNDPDNFVVQQHKDYAGRIVRISISPIEIGKYAARFFDRERQLFMSATIHKETFCRTMDLPESACAFIEVAKSPFPTQHRRITFHNMRRLNYRSAPDDYDAVYRKVGEILTQHRNEKGLILTTTKKQCKEIRDAVGGRVTIAHEGVEGKREAILEEHARTGRPNVLASPSFWYGVDLKDDLSRFQIVIKAPYPSMADKRTKVKAERDRLWYRYAALVKLLQGFGRSVRSEDDYCDTYVLDEAAWLLLSEMKRFVPLAYHDSLGW